MLRAAYLVVIAVLALTASPAAAQRRLALVIGISEYQHLRSMVRPAGDARAVHDALTRLGFQSNLVLDANQNELDAAFQRLLADVQQDDVALIHFTGHGGRGRDDYLLLPADAPGQGASDAELQRMSALGVHALAEQIRGTGARAQIFIVDACRGDPYADGAAADLAPARCGEVGRQMPEGSFALFSASAGQKALDRLSADDTDPHSLFTRVYLRRLGQVRSVTRLSRVVRDEVVELATSVNYEQRPAYLDEFAGPPVLLSARDADDPPASARQDVPPPQIRREREVILIEPPARGPAEPRPRAPEVVIAPPPAPPRAESFQCGSANPGPPSFNCRAARGAAEVAICRDPRLGSCDEVLGDVFERAQARVGRNAPGLRREQEDWLSRRDACAGLAADVDALTRCIGRAYDERIAELDSVARSTPAVASPSFDCRRARTAVEQVICTVPTLAARDREMAALYERAVLGGANRSRAAEASQNDWRAARDACARAAPQGADALATCVGQAYDIRIRELRGLMAVR